MRITCKYLAAIASLLLMLSSPVAVYGQEPAAGLLASARTDAQDPAAGKAWFVRSRSVRLDREVLAALGQGRARELTVGLFDDVAVRPIFRHFDSLGPDGYTWTGGLRDHALSSFVLSVYRGVMVAVLRSVATGTYQIRPGPGGIHFVRQVDPSKMGRCGLGPTSPGIGGGAAEPRASEDETPRNGGRREWHPSTIDVLVVYTPAAEQSEGGGDAMAALIHAAVADANDRFSNSQIAHRLRLVRWDKIAYVESGTSENDLDRLRAPGDNHMDEVHEWRDAVGGDLVSLLVEDFALDDGIAGRGKMPLNANAFVPSMGFSVVIADEAVGGGTFAHELGHNFGCHHHPDDEDEDGIPAADDEPVYAYAYGHRFGAFRTTMAYPARMLVSHFSNPDVTHGGPATGTDERDNARVIDNTGPTVAGYLPSFHWVDVGYSGDEHGTRTQPWNTVQEGIDNVPSGGTLIFKPGTSVWTGSITTRSMTLKSYDGSMVIGN